MNDNGQGVESLAAEAQSEGRDWVRFEQCAGTRRAPSIAQVLESRPTSANAINDEVTMTSILQIQEPRPLTHTDVGEGNMAAQPTVSSYSGPPLHVTVTVNAVAGGPMSAGLTPEERFFNSRMLFWVIVGVAVAAAAAAIPFLLR